MLPPIWQRLQAVPALVNIVQERIYRHGNVPQDSATAPYIAWALVGAEPANTLSELPSRDRQSVQIDIYSADDAQVEQIATLVRDAIEPVAHMLGVIIDSRETDTKLYRMSLQFDWWLIRP